MTNSIAFGSSTARLRYHDMFHKRVSLLDHYSVPFLCFFPHTECPFSRHKPVFGFSRLRGRCVNTTSKYMFPLPLPHTAGIFLLTIKGHPITFSPAQFCAYILPLLQPRSPCRAAETRRPSPRTWLPSLRELLQKGIVTSDLMYQQGLSTLCLCSGLVGELCNSLLTCMATSPPLPVNLFFFPLELYAGIVYRHSVRYAEGNKKLFWMFTTFCYACVSE